MTVSCLFCGKEVLPSDSKRAPAQNCYMCKRCGHIRLTEEAASDFGSERFSEQDKTILTIAFRQDWERRGKRNRTEELSLDDLYRMIAQFHHLDPIEKMDNALMTLDKLSRYVGEPLNINQIEDYPLYYCQQPEEFIAICLLLLREGFTSVPDQLNLQKNITITAKGYQRLRQIQRPNKDSTQCFVAMWFTPEMNEVFLEAIKPAIEYINPGQAKPRFEAVKIDNVEHVNDINDEIIAQIRRSRFMVCDLSGYRGGVYFEAGFAYGLGLEVIYTCGKDWAKEELLSDASGEKVRFLFDSSGHKVDVRKEGVHFDLAHRNRIEWEPTKLDDFRKRLENRIKAVIV